MGRKEKRSYTGRFTFSLVFCAMATNNSSDTIGYEVQNGFTEPTSGSTPEIIVLVIVAALVIAGVVFGVLFCLRRKKAEPPQSAEDGGAVEETIVDSGARGSARKEEMEIFDTTST